MAHPRLCLLFVLLSCVVVSATTTGAAVGGEREFVYNGFYGNDLSMDGEASLVDGLLQLTPPDNEMTKGHAFYAYPLNFSSLPDPDGPSVPSFSTTFVFSIMGTYLDLSSHGLAFVLSPTKDFFSALPGQYLGVVNIQNNGNTSNHLLAIELDTVQNPEFNDIDDNHVGIDVNSLISVAASPAGYYASDGLFRNMSLISGKPIQVWVDYESKSSTLNVTVAPLQAVKPSKALLTVACNLSSLLTTTRDSPVYAGFSASTGVVDSRHYILGWSFKVNGEAAALNYTALSLNTIQNLARQLRPLPRRSKSSVVPAVIQPTLAITILVVAALKVCMKMRSKARENELDWEREYGPPSFTYKDLLAATDGFKDKLLLGKGGFGSVFRGVLPHSKQTVAIKRVSPESKQGMKEFMAEIVILGHLRHRNLVQLLGYCRHKQQLLLVYDYMPNRSLDCYLHSQENTTTNGGLNWAQRFCIIKGVASGLFYLHEEWEQVIIHRDIKSSNVLLDAEMNARLGDFGLARSHDHGADAHTTRMAGTWGYIAPELARLGKATKATDVFALGVLMMEVVCGRRPIWVNADDGEPVALADWVLAAWRAGSITDAIDPRLLLVEEEEAAVELVLKLGLLCSHPLPSARPCMRLVMQYLLKDAPLPADLQPDNLLLSSYALSQEDDLNAISYPLTTITDLSKGR